MYLCMRNLLTSMKCVKDTNQKKRFPQRCWSWKHHIAWSIFCLTIKLLIGKFFTCLAWNYLIWTNNSAYIKTVLIYRIKSHFYLFLPILKYHLSIRNCVWSFWNGLLNQGRQTSCYLANSVLRKRMKENLTSNSEPNISR